MVEKAGKGRKEVVVTREYTINLHKRLHGCNLTLFFSVASPCVCFFSKPCFQLLKCSPPSFSLKICKMSYVLPKIQFNTLELSISMLGIILYAIISTSTYGVGGSVACHGESE
ncbi:unnamed protein product [Musa banksii]